MKSLSIEQNNYDLYVLHYNIHKGTVPKTCDL